MRPLAVYKEPFTAELVCGETVLTYQAAKADVVNDQWLARQVNQQHGLAFALRRTVAVTAQQGMGAAQPVNPLSH